jgi:hypothetical protein
VHWVIHFDPRGEQSLRYRCKNVNLVEKTVKGVEDELEFLFVPSASHNHATLTFPRTLTHPAPPLQILRVHRHVHHRSRQNHR